MSTTEDLLQSSNCDLTNKIVTVTEAKLQDHGREQKEVIMSTTEVLLNKPNKDLRLKYQNLEKELQTLQLKIDFIDVYSRRDNLIVCSFSNPDSTPRLSLVHSLLDLFNKQLGLDIKNSDISLEIYDLWLITFQEVIQESTNQYFSGSQLAELEIWSSWHANHLRPINHLERLTSTLTST